VPPVRAPFFRPVDSRQGIGRPAAVEYAEAQNKEIHVSHLPVHAGNRRPTPLGPKRNPPGPVVIWNLIRRCNLTCKHCYSISADTNFPGELSTEQVYAVMDDLKGFKVPVLILSGGEPLLRPDIYDIAKRAKAEGFYVGLSSNGTLIDERNIERIAECDFNYVGVSLDGLGATHDKFRRLDGAFDASLKGIRLCRDLGLKIGVRFTMTQDNAHDLPGLLKLVEDEGIDRFYFSHLNYAGRGNKNRKDDAQYQLTRQAMDLLFDTCWEYQQRGLEKEFTTGNNDADGVYFLHWVRRRFPARRRTSNPSCASGAAIRRASMSPTSTTSATSTRTPCGGITRWATSRSGRSRRSGRIPRTR
jgi:MoaA/NifB/PqqE/SkfB family radical SAM enzyme